MSSRSILIAVLGLTLNGCAVYDYDDERYDSRYYGGGYSVQRYEAYPVYPGYSRGYRYDYPRHEGYSTRYYYQTRHDGRHDRDDHDRYDRHDRDDRRHEHRGHDQPRPQPGVARPGQRSWDGHRQQGLDQGRRPHMATPAAGRTTQQVNRGHERKQDHRQDRPRSRYGDSTNGMRRHVQ